MNALTAITSRPPGGAKVPRDASEAQDRLLSGACERVEQPVETMSRSGAMAATPCRPATNPWPALQRLGLVGAAHGTKGPLGHALDSAIRQGLLDSVTRLGQNGVTFELERTWRIPLVMSKYVALDAPQVVARLEDHGCEKLAFTHGAEVHVSLADLDEIRAVDGVYGQGGDALGPDDRAACAAVADLVGAGYEVTPGTWSRNIGGTPFQNWKMVQRFPLDIGTRRRLSERAADLDDLLTLGYLKTGIDRGVKNLQAAQRLRGLEEKGIAVLSTGTTLDLVKSLSSPCATAEWMRFQRVNSDLTLRLDRATLGNPTAAVAQLDEAERLWRKYVEPLAGKKSIGWIEVNDFLNQPCQRFSKDARGKTLEWVMRAEQTVSPLETWQYIDTATRLEALSKDAAELAMRGRQYALAGCLMGARAARIMLDLVDSPDTSPTGG